MAYLEIPGVGFIANQLIGADVKEKLGEQVINGLEKWDAGDELGATADFSQVVAVTMAGVLATVMMDTGKTATAGLTPVFQSAAWSKGFVDNMLEKIGYRFPVTSWLGRNLHPTDVQKLANWGVNTAVGYSTSWWVDKIIDAFNSFHLGIRFYDFLHTDQVTNDFFKLAQTWRPYVPVDPLALDLDNDGIETTAINGWNGVLFDHNNDGVKTATGWLKGDDGFLVLDRNGNGLIDNGGELFGDNTKLGNGVNATDGFAALADVDTNYDHLIDVNDGIFPLLKVWQDLNQDGISQANELKTLTELGITSLATESVIFYKKRLINFISSV